LCRRIRVQHFQLQCVIGSYGYEPMELYLVHGVLAFLAVVVMHWILMQVCSTLSFRWARLSRKNLTHTLNV